MARNIEIDTLLQEYILRVGVREHEALATLRRETATLPSAGWQIGADQGAFMQFVVRAIAAKHCLEIGTFTGYSALAVALALPKFGRLVTCEVNFDWTTIAKRHWLRAGVADKIELRLGRALETLDQLLADGGAGTFDFVFIDADKLSYEIYFERCLDLVRTGGVIAVDNVLWGGRVVGDRHGRGAIKTASELLKRFLKRLRRGDFSGLVRAVFTLPARLLRTGDPNTETQAIREFNEARAADERVFLSMVPIGDGITLMIKR